MDSGDFIRARPARDGGLVSRERGMGTTMPQRRVSLLLREYVRRAGSDRTKNLMRRVLFAAVVLAGCGSPVKQAAAPPPPPPVKDDRLLLLAAHQISARVVPDHLLGKMALPGGTIGEYDDGGKKYQLFIIETETAQDAAFLLVDFKPLLTNPAYISYMGGYFGPDATNGT